MPKDRTILTIPNDAAYLPIIGAYVKATAAQIGFDDADGGDIQLAVNEACSHIIETAFEPGEEQDLTISCQRSSSGLQITIADKGMPFDPRSIQGYDARGGLDRDLSGLPFYLIQQAMDEVRFVNSGWKGKELQLTKYLKVPSVETYFTQEALRPYDTRVERAPPGEYTYRLMEQNDAIEVARCVYKTYGYTYPGEHVYFPERLAAMNDSGEMISAVAVTETGEVVAHCALSRQPDAPVMEVGQASVVPAYRSRGITDGLVDLLQAEVRRLRVAGLYVQAVTLHPFSQQMYIKYGFHESAVLLGYAPRRIQMARFADRELAQRETMIYAYRSLREEPRSLAFPPAHHRPMLEKIYGNLGLEREFGSAEAAAQGAGSSGLPAGAPPLTLATQVVSALEIAMMQVVAYGPGIEQEVKSKLRDLCHKGIAVVFLHLPLGDPHTAALCQRFEELGFFFCGIKPRPAEPAGPEGTSTGDQFCLQYLNGPRIDYDRLQICSDFGRELVGYVRARDPLG